jgi:hypothetical protein
MTARLENKEVLAFCHACSWAFQAWSIHRGFQDHLSEESAFVRCHAFFLNRLSFITQEYSLLQIAKLHDRADQFGNINLGIDFIIERGDWDDITRTRLDDMRQRLSALPAHLSGARNKILAHNDRDAAVASRALGGFPEGMDDEYFETLQVFVSLVHDKCIGGPFLFDKFAKIDTTLFIDALPHERNEAPKRTLPP